MHSRKDIIQWNINDKRLKYDDGYRGYWYLAVIEYGNTKSGTVILNSWINIFCFNETIMYTESM